MSHPLAPALLIASAHALTDSVGISAVTGTSALLVRRYLADVGYHGTDDGPEDGGWSAAFVHHAGYWSHYEYRFRASVWPLPATASCAELARFAEALEQTQGSFRTVLIHHPPLSPARRFFRRLIDAADLRRVLTAKGAELLLHGHDHRQALVWLHGAGNMKIPAIGVPSVSAYAKHGGEDPAGYNIFRIEGSAGSWRCETVCYQRGEDGAMRECSRFRIY